MGDVYRVSCTKNSTNSMKYSLLILFYAMIFHSSYLFGQEIKPESIVLFNNENVKITGVSVKCNDLEMGISQIKTLLTVNNLSGKELKIKWHNSLYYDNKCATCESIQENSYEINIKPNESVKGQCFKGLPGLSIYQKDLQGFIQDNLTKIVIDNLQISNIIPN